MWRCTMSSTMIMLEFSQQVPPSKKSWKFNRYREMTEVYEELTEEKVYINKNMDPRYPLMARAIYENGDIKMIIMLWGLSWEKMTLGQANFLTVVSYLIQNAVLRAQRYMQALEENRYSEEGSRILREDAFKPLVKAYMDAEAKIWQNAYF